MSGVAVQRDSSKAAHLAAGSTLCQEVAQQGGMVHRPAVLQQQQQAAERQAAGEQAVEVRVAAGQQRLAVQAGARPRICRRCGGSTNAPKDQSGRQGQGGGQQGGRRAA